MALCLRSLTLEDAGRCAQLVLEHGRHDPGYQFVWGSNPDYDSLQQMYTGKLQRLIGEPTIRTWGTYRENTDSSDLIAFAAWNPPNYTKSWSLYMRQKWASSSIWRSWPMSVIYPSSSSTRTPLQERHALLSKFRQEIERDVVARLGSNHIWVMHIAGEMEGLDKLVKDKIYEEATASENCPTRFSAQHSEAMVGHALAKWQCSISAEGTFQDPTDSTAVPIRTVFLVKSA